MLHHTIQPQYMPRKSQRTPKPTRIFDDYVTGNEILEGLDEVDVDETSDYDEENKLQHHRLAAPRHVGRVLAANVSRGNITVRLYANATQIHVRIERVNEGRMTNSPLLSQMGNLNRRTRKERNLTVFMEP